MRVIYNKMVGQNKSISQIGEYGRLEAEIVWRLILCFKKNPQKFFLYKE